MEVRAIVVAGGSGSRLAPLTDHTHKTLLPLQGRPIIDYVLASIRNAGITKITIIGNKFIGKIRQHVGEGVDYILENEPLGVANALNLARENNQNCSLLVWFSDNITNLDLTEDVAFHSKLSSGATLLVREVENPQDFGIATIEEGEIIGVEEKPLNPKSNLAIGGIYFFDESFWNRFDKVSKSPDFSISDVTRQYIVEESVQWRNVGENTWIDCGTPESLQRAALMVEGGLFKVQGA